VKQKFPNQLNMFISFRKTLLNVRYVFWTDQQERLYEFLL